MDNSLSSIRQSEFKDACKMIAREIKMQATEEDIFDYDEILECIFDPIIDNVRLEVDNVLFRLIETEKAAK